MEPPPSSHVVPVNAQEQPVSVIQPGESAQFVFADTMSVEVGMIRYCQLDGGELVQNMQRLKKYDDLKLLM